MRAVVIIDDEPVIRGMMARHLAQHGWRVHEADDGDTGLRLVRAHHPQAVICDLLMPGTNGFKVCRAIRAERAELGDVLIVVTTGSGFPSDRQNALESGANHYLLKPVRPREILTLLDEAVPEPAIPADRPDPASVPGVHTVIRYWGVRGWFPVPGPTTLRHGGNTPCVEVRAAGEVIVLDAGTGIIGLGERLAREFHDRPLTVTLLLTHVHWDHIQGLPFFLPALGPRHAVRILGPEGAKQPLAQALALQTDSPFFPLDPAATTARVSVEEIKDLDFTLGRVRVRATFLNHPGITLGYRLDAPGGTVVYLPDHEIPPASAESPGHQAEFRDYKSQLLAEFAQGAGLLVCDAAHRADEPVTERRRGHTSVEEAVALARLAQARRLHLFHHDPASGDERVDALVAHARELASAAGSTLAVEAAREGAEVELTPAPR